MDASHYQMTSAIAAKKFDVQQKKGSEIKLKPGKSHTTNYHNKKPPGSQAAPGS